jgi:hypothetical protein
MCGGWGQLPEEGNIGLKSVGEVQKKSIKQWE